MFKRFANWLVVFQNPAARLYMLVGLAALGVLLFALMQKESGIGALLACLFGTLGLLTRWRIWPLLLAPQPRHKPLCTCCWFSVFCSCLVM